MVLRCFLKIVPKGKSKPVNLRPENIQTTWPKLGKYLIILEKCSTNKVTLEFTNPSRKILKFELKIT